MKNLYMKNKYYTPAIDEFYVGFEYEVAEIKSADLITGEQEHKIWVHKFYDQGDLIDLYYNYKPDFDSVTFDKTKLRVKYLDQKDIESLGFKFTGKSIDIWFEKEGSFLQALEKCSGSGDCRKTEVIGGTLCPSYMATRNEKDTTRARARILRDYIVYGDKEVFNNSNIKEVLDLCLSCKACISECPSSVDMASIKASYLNEYLKHNPATFSHRVYANFYKISKKIAPFAPLLNIVNQNPLLNWLPKVK